MAPTAKIVPLCKQNDRQNLGIGQNSWKTNEEDDGGGHGDGDGGDDSRNMDVL